MQCDVVARLYQTMDGLNRKDRMPRELAEGLQLNRADVQFLDAVAQMPGQSASALAEALQVTRGAVTQWCQRLEGFGLIVRQPVAGNRKTRRTLLTPAGENVLTERDRQHREANDRLCGHVQALEPSQRQAIMGFLALAASLHISPFQCVHGSCTPPDGGEQAAMDQQE